jgi:hypothetical protein
MSVRGTLKMIFALNCREASELMSRRMDEKLSVWERAALRGHLLVCGACRRVKRQLHFLREALRSETRAGHVEPPEQLGPEARARIDKALRQQSDDAT